MWYTIETNVVHSGMRTSFQRRPVTSLNQNLFHFIRQVITDRNQLSDFTPPRTADRTAGLNNRHISRVFSTIWSPVSSISDGRVFLHAAVFRCFSRKNGPLHFPPASPCEANRGRTAPVFAPILVLLR